MKKVILLTIASLVLVGCGTRTVVVEKTVPSTNAPSYEPPATTPSYQSKDDIYLEIIRDEYPNVIRDMGSAWVVEFAGIVCNAIDNGLTVSGLAQIAISSGADAETIGFLTGAAIPIYCPHNRWFINSVN